MYAEIILSKVAKNIDKIFHYAIPDDLKEQVRIGVQVRIPFGRRVEIGYVVGLAERTNIKGVKKIIEVTSPNPLFDEKGVVLARWISEYYLAFFIRALRLVMPVGTKQREKPEASLKLKRKRKVSAKERELAELNSDLKVLSPTVTLTTEQAAALTQINIAIDNELPGKFLLYGVTGSGKTEVYLQAVARVLGKGGGVMALVPEIGLTPQFVERFRQRFLGNIAVLHSGLSDNERYIEWQRIASGEARIVVGTRLSLFAPVKKLALIIIDEEYENTYKSDMSPRYHAREVALKLGELHQAVVVIGSATPSVETFYLAEKGEYKKLTLSRRIDDRPLPPVEIIDMRKEEEYVFSNRLRQEIKETYERGEQSILFINRRAFYTFIMCKSCGQVIECPHCASSLAYYSQERRLNCNQCGYTASPSISCPRCNSIMLKFSGIGTQRIDDEVAKLVPSARIIRFDRDATTKKGSHEAIFRIFAEKKADIMIGTQLVTKGMDIANVTLVGVVSADIGLNFPDFRAGEHTFQLLTQVAGRAGRHHLPGKVIIQTYQPNHYAIKCAAKHNYEEFYQQEIKQRAELSYPPFCKLISLMFHGQEPKKVCAVADQMAKFLQKRLIDGVLGPADAVMPKLRGLWRFGLLLKGKDLDLMRAAVKEAIAKMVIPMDIRLTIDVDPQTIN